MRTWRSNLHVQEFLKWIFLALLVVKDMEGKVKGETIMENDKVIDFVLKDLYGKIETEGKGNLLDKGNVLWIFWVMF